MGEEWGCLLRTFVVSGALAMASCDGGAEREQRAQPEAWNLKPDTLIHSAPFTELLVARDNSFSLDGRPVASAELPEMIARMAQLKPAPVLFVTYEGEKTPGAWSEIIALAESGYCSGPGHWCWKGPLEDAPQEIREKRSNRPVEN